MSDRFDGHDPLQGDTAGVPWAGRTLSGTGFDGDEGDADAALMRALTSPPPRHGPRQDAVLVHTVAAARLIVPIVAVPGETATSDMAAVTLSSPDGRKALPCFSSTEHLQAWDTRARPVPVSAQRAALAAVQEGCDVMVLDVGTDHARELRTSMVWALAMGRDWLPAHEDEHVAAAVKAAAQGESQILEWTLADGEAGALLITVTLIPAMTPTQINDILQRVATRIATDGEARARIDAIAFQLVGESTPHQHSGGGPRPG